MFLKIGITLGIFLGGIVHHRAGVNNFDGASKGNPGILGCGIIIKNMSGNSLGVMAIPIGEQTNHVVEASVALHDLIFVKSMNLKKIWLKGDSLNIINLS